MPLFGLLLPLLASAQGVGCGGLISNPLCGRNIPTILSTILGFLIGAGGVIATIIVVYAGILFLFSGGNPGKVSEARQTIFYAVIGYAIIVLAWGIVMAIKQILGV